VDHNIRGHVGLWGPKSVTKSEKDIQKGSKYVHSRLGATADEFGGEGFGHDGTAGRALGEDPRGHVPTVLRSSEFLLPER